MRTDFKNPSGPIYYKVILFHEDTNVQTTQRANAQVNNSSYKYDNPYKIGLPQTEIVILLFNTKNLNVQNLKYLSILPFLLLGTTLIGQTSKQAIKGLVIDKNSEIPIIGATIELLDEENTTGVITDVDGYFLLPDVNVGRHIVRISYLGYNTITIPEILLTAGKEYVLNVTLEESVYKMDEVVVTAKIEKDKAINDMATISARSFSLEEVTRFSGGRNDASRMAANFAGVLINNDSRNDLIIRGNSPIGVLWRLEGIAIPSPNHFSTLGSTGGPVSALNTNLLSNSDFLTGAFPAEYGNASAGVFDIQFRNGNKDKYEFTAQLAAFSGLEFMAEGPLNKKGNGSFLVAYRRSFVELAQEAGLNVGTTATPAYQDLTFKIDFGKSKLGRFYLFGIGGDSDIDFQGNNIDEEDFFAENDRDSYATSEIGIIGLNHRLLLNNKSYLKTSIAASTSQNDYREELIIGDGRQKHLDINDRTTRYTFSTLFNTKLNARHTLRLGYINEYFDLNNLGQDLKSDVWVPFREFEGGMDLMQLYAQSKYKFTEDLTLNIGLHTQYLTFNDDYSIEPRAGLKWQMASNKSLSLGFGVHEQMLPLPVYLQNHIINGQDILSNRDVNFTRSTQYVLGYDHTFEGSWRFKSEVYYQNLTNIPVEETSNAFSLLNLGDDFGFPELGKLNNEGTGSNYGIEYTLEKFFSKGYYALLTGSFYDSEYKGSDGINRNTAFNNQHIVNFLAGKEFRLGKSKRNALTFDFKFTNAGGRYYTPIDLEKSRQFGTEIKNTDLAYTERYAPYLRLDLKVGFQLNSGKKKFSQQFYLDFQNVTNHKNVFLQQYNASVGEVGTLYQIGFFPDVLYRVQF